MYFQICVGHINDLVNKSMKYKSSRSNVYLYIWRCRLRKGDNFVQEGVGVNYYVANRIDFEVMGLY